jgi:hypothetical protein
MSIALLAAVECDDLPTIVDALVHWLTIMALRWLETHRATVFSVGFRGTQDSIHV